MALSVLPLDLVRWDEAARATPGRTTVRECLVLAVFEDDRPLRGAAGLADWRLCGRLSKLLKANRATGKAGETMLLPPGHRLPFDSLSELRAGLYAAHPHLQRIDQIAAGRPDDVKALAGAPTDVGREPFASPIADFYLTNPIARASAVMAECSALAAGHRLATAAE